MQITKREILMSIAIFLVMLGIAIGLTFMVLNISQEHDEVYHKALQLEDEDAIEHAKNTGAGLAFVKVVLDSDNSVSHPNLIGEYLYIKEYVEKYTEHERVVTETDSEGNTHTRVETYWQWDYYDSQVTQVDSVRLNNIEINSDELNFPSKSLKLTDETCTVSHWGTSYIEKNDWFGPRLRYSYTIVEKGGEYSSLVFFENGEMNAYNSSKISLHDSTVKELYESCLGRQKLWLILVWLGWALVTFLLIFGFYYLDNMWLNSD